ncbi:MAG: potassium transporter, partial [Bacteroidetes bacterium]|nr:potassium transporter [Bacteroidota bacterium]
MSLEESDAEFLILLKATDETFMQQVHIRYSYTFEDVHWGAKFKPMFDSGVSGNVSVRISDLDQHLPASLNT